MTILYWTIGIVLSIACAVTCAWICDKYDGCYPIPRWVNVVVFTTFIPGIPTFVTYMAICVVVGVLIYLYQLVTGKWPPKKGSEQR